MLVDQEPVSVQYFMAGILQEKGEMRDDTNCDDQMLLDYQKDEHDDQDDDKGGNDPIAITERVQ